MPEHRQPSPAIADSAFTPEQIARLRKLCEEATPGPWGWRGHDDGLVELRGHGPFGRLDGRVISAQRSEPCIVATHEDEVVLTLEACDECRLKWAQMLEQGHTDMWESYRCPKPENLATVWLKGEHAIEPANTWAVRERPYRSDVARVDHPDAELIAEARNALPALLDAVERLRSGLEHIADGQECTNYTGSPWCRDDSSRSRDAKYGADRWCDTCIARDALTSAAVSSPETDQ